MRSARLAVPFPWKGATHTQALSAQLWSIDGSACAVWPKNLRRVVQMSGGWSVRRQTSSLEMRTLQEMHNICCRHHWSGCSIRILWEGVFVWHTVSGEAILSTGIEYVRKPFLDSPTQPWTPGSLLTQCTAGPCSDRPLLGHSYFYW